MKEIHGDQIYEHHKQCDQLTLPARYVCNYKYKMNKLELHKVMFRYYRRIICLIMEWLQKSLVNSIPLFRLSLVTMVTLVHRGFRLSYCIFSCSFDNLLSLLHWVWVKVMRLGCESQFLFFVHCLL